MSRPTDGPASGADDRLAVLAELPGALSPSRALDELALEVLRALARVTDARRALMFLAGASGEGVRVFMGVDSTGGRLSGEDLGFDGALLRDAMSRAEPGEIFEGEPWARRVLIVPIAGRRGVLGCLYADLSDAASPGDGAALALARIVAAQAAPAFELKRHGEARRRADRVTRENALLRESSRRQSEEARTVDELNRRLIRTSAFLESLLESSTEHAIVAFDLKGRVTTWNTGAERTYGWTRDQMIGAQLDVLLRPEDRRSDLIDSMAQAACEDGAGVSAETVRLKRDGALIDVQSALTAIRDARGAVSGYLDISRDVSAEHEMRRQVLLSEKMAALGTLSAGVAHEFNNLLQGITGFLGHALEREDPDQWRRAMRVALDAANRASLLTGRLQAFARPQVTGTLPTHLPDVVDDTLALVERSFESEGVELVRVYDADLRPALADRSRISQVLLNLLTNARHAVAQAEQRRVVVRVVSPEPGWLEVAVEDTGCGIPLEVQSRIFEPFFTTKGALGGEIFDGKVHGTGLGLSISNGIVTEHGGRLDVESRPGRGTVFRILLPEASTAPEPTVDSPSPSRLPERPRVLCVLVVDDEGLVRDWLKQTLEARGHQVVVAGDGREGLRLFGVGDFDCVVADWKMPGMDGGRFFREVASRASADRPPRRVLITGRQQTERDEAWPSGLHAVLHKPCTAEELIDAIEGEARPADAVPAQEAPWSRSDAGIGLSPSE